MKAQRIPRARTYPGNDALDASRAIAALAALAQSTRLAIFRLLVEHAPEGLTPGALAVALDIAPATLSFHLKELANAGLVADQREGRNIRYRADVAAMNALVGYLTDHCCRATGRLTDACGAACAPAASAPAKPPTRSPR